MLPPASLVASYALRGLRLWALTRAAVSILMLLTIPGVEPLRVTPTTSAGVVLLSVGVCFVDCWRHHELPLIRNLGVSLSVVAAVFLVPVALGETVLSLLGRIIT